VIPAAYEVRGLVPQLVFDPVDVYAEERAVAGPHPRPLAPLSFRLVGEVAGGQRQDFERPIDLEVVTNPTGFAVFLGGVPATDGVRRRLVLAAGTYVVRVESSAYQTVEREDILVPQGHPAPGPYLVALEPGFAYPFPKASTLGAGRGPTLLRGCLLERGGAGVAGAEVLVAGQSNTYRTAAGGQWVLVFPDAQPAGNVTVRFRLPQPGGGFNDLDVAGVAIVPGRNNAFLQAALAGRVETQAATPVPGARVRVIGEPGETVAGGDGSWRYYFPVDQGAGAVDVEARHPDGSTQTRFNVPVTAGETTPVETFRF
jgi:hypothetical protein